jgi:hypothetical protein
VKRLIALLVLAGFITLAVAETYKPLRINGTSTVSGGIFYLVCDSTDTFQVDTFFSDTLEIDKDVDYFNIAVALLGYSLADSGNDSVEIISRVQTAYPGMPALTIYTDTFTTTLDSTEVQRHHLYRDTMLENLVWVQTIVSDSFILGEGKDSMLLKMQVHTLTQDKTN